MCMLCDYGQMSGRYIIEVLRAGLCAVTMSALSCFGAPQKAAVSVSPETVEVLVDAKATSPTRFAVQELTNFLSRVFSSPVPVVTAPTSGRVQIVVGDNKWSRAVGLAPETLEKDDAFIIRADAGRIYLCGVDGDCPWYADVINGGRGGPGMMQGRRSSSFAVYEFLERYAGCRFYWPGELGEYVPRAREVRVPLGVTRHEPELLIRRYYHPVPVGVLASEGNGWMDGSEYTFAKGTMLNWSRLRMGTFSIPCCHGVNRFYMLDRFGKTHPEYFALKKNGSRFTSYDGYESSKWGMLCFSSAVTNEIYLDVKSYLSGEDPSVRKICRDKNGKWVWPTCFAQGKYADIMPNDSQYACQCERCLSRYTPKEVDPSNSFMSELIWRYTADVANRLIADGVPGYVTQMAYAQYRRPPAFDIPTNVLVMVAKTGPYSIRKAEQLAEDNGAIRAWKAKTGRVWIWTYPNKYGSLNVAGVPTMTPRAWGRYYKMVAHDIFGAFAESECDRFFFNHLNYYVFSKVCWDSSTDVDALLDEYYRLMYGAAASEARELCEALEDKFLDEVVGKVEDTPEGPVAKAPSLHDIWTKIYGPSTLDGWERLLDRGAAKLADGSIEARRFKVLRDELLGVMRRTAEPYLEKTDAARNAARYRSSPPMRNLIDMKNGAWYAARRDASTKIVSESSFKIVSTNGGATTLYYLDGRCGETLKPNTRYRLSFFVKGEGIVPKQKGGGAGFTLFNAYPRTFPASAGLAGTFDWIHQTFDFTTDPETNNRCRSCFYLRINGANGTAWFDGVSLVEIPDQVAKPGACAVVVARDAPKTTAFAASELSRFLSRRFSGREVPVRTSRRDGEFSFVVGDGAIARSVGIDVSKMPRDGFAVKSFPGGVVIAGRDDPVEDLAASLSAGKVPYCEMASVFGVYDFLERFADCRFFFPGKLGEVVRLGDDLPLQKLDYTSAPDCAERIACGGGGVSRFRGDGARGKALNRIRTRMLKGACEKRGVAGVPCFAPLASGKFCRERKEGKPAAFASFASDRWFHSHLDDYVRGKVSWKTDTNVEILVDDYLNRMFGPVVAQRFMGPLVKSLEEKWMVVGNRASLPSGEEVWTKIFDPKTLAGYDARLSAAFKEAEKLGDPLVAKRVMLYRREIYEPMKAASDAYFAGLRKGNGK